MLSGDNGLLKRAGDARDDTVVGQEKEQVELAYISAAVNKLGGDVEEEDLRIELNNSVGNGKTTVSTNDDNTFNVYFTETEHNYNVDGGTVAKIEDSTIKITEFSISGTSVAEADIPVPTGFTHTEGTKDTGYVIQDGDGNEFVWVPVDKDQKITLKITSEEDITELKLYDPYGDEINLGTVSGKTYENTNITPTVNGGYTVKITTTNETKIKTIGVRSLYAMDTYSDFWGSNEGIEYRMRNLGYYTEDVMDLVYSYEFSTIEEYKIKCQSSMKNYYVDTEDYTSKVNSNGGFYVGRYEAGKEDDSLVIKSNKEVYEGISYADALSKSQTYKSSANSSLLTGAAWDRTLGWFIETKNKTISQIVTDSTGWGNYSSNLANSGNTNNAISNNIYDLAGNVFEWTTEELKDYGDDWPLRRGGCYDAGWKKSFYWDKRNVV